MSGIGKQVVILAVITGAVGTLAYVAYEPHPCLEPLRYSIGRVDKEFGLATTTFHAIIAEAEEPWEIASGKDLFVFDPTADFTINLIYDERQELTDEAREVREELEALRAERERVREEHRSLTARYDQEKNVFESMVRAYDEALSEYNEDVQQWNSRGGAPPSVAEELRARQRSLADARQELEAQQNEVNALIDQINRTAQNEQEIVEAFNEIVGVYRVRHGGAHEFEQGHATPNEINVYQFLQRSDLRLVLAHEFGHTLGIEHVDDPQAVMYRLMKEQASDPIVLTDTDLEMLAGACASATYWPWPF
ncbi:MAG: matrixin family metalloprotease [Candidatus Paceibacterota bacterium]